MEILDSKNTSSSCLGYLRLNMTIALCETCFDFQLPLPAACEVGRQLGVWSGCFNMCVRGDGNNI